MGNLKNKIALVTGGSRGIGRAIAIKLAEEGATVIIHYVTSDSAARDTLDEIRSVGGDGYLVKADLAETRQWRSLFRQLDLILEDESLDIMINNAAMLIRKDFDQLTEDEFDAIFTVNVKAPYFITRHIIQRMKDGGRIINLSSTVSRRPRVEACAYSMTKAAIDNFTMSLAKKLGGRRITVNSIAPGVTDTDMNRDRLRNELLRSQLENSITLKRIGTSTDIAHVVSFLASDAAEWITGQYIEASGGAGL